MAIVTLRKLTRLSKLGALCHRYANNTVEEVLKIKPKYLVWVYYHIQNITFMDDILEELHIYKRDKIAKPGVDREAFERHHKKFVAWLAANQKWGALKHMQKRQKKKNLEWIERIESKETLSKGLLQAINHGHCKY